MNPSGPDAAARPQLPRGPTSPADDLPQGPVSKPGPSDLPARSSVIQPHYNDLMRIFGIDPGSVRTGYGCVSCAGSKLHSIGYGAIETNPRGEKRSFPERLERIHSELRRLILDFEPEVVAVEEVFYAVNVKTALKLGHARGVILLAAAESHLPIFEYSPLEIKKSVVGYGRADKGQVQLMVKTLLNLGKEPQPEDAADALAVAICHGLNGGPQRNSSGTWRTHGAQFQRSRKRFKRS